MSGTAEAALRPAACERGRRETHVRKKLGAPPAAAELAQAPAEADGTLGGSVVLACWPRLGDDDATVRRT